MSADVKLSKAQFSKMIQWVALLHDMLGSFRNIGKKVIADLPIPLCKCNLLGLVSAMQLKM